MSRAGDGYPRSTMRLGLTLPRMRKDWKRVADLWPYALLTVSVAGLLYRWWRSLRWTPGHGGQHGDLN